MAKKHCTTLTEKNNSCIYIQYLEGYPPIKYFNRLLLFAKYLMLLRVWAACQFWSSSKATAFKWVASSLLSSVSFNSVSSSVIIDQNILTPRAADNGCFSSQQPACNYIKCLYDWQKCSESNSKSDLRTSHIGVQYGATHKHSKRWATSIWSKRGWVVKIPNRSAVRAFKPNSRGLTGPQRTVPSCVPRNALTCVAKIHIWCT